MQVFNLLKQRPEGASAWVALCHDPFPKSKRTSILKVHAGRSRDFKAGQWWGPATPPPPGLDGLVSLSTGSVTATAADAASSVSQVSSRIN